EDLTEAKTLYRDLKDKGVSPFLEQKDLLPGQHRDNTVNKAIRESDYFIALLSSKSVAKRGFIQKRLKTGIRIFEEFCDTDVFIIPVRLDDCELPGAMASLAHVDIFPSYADCLSKILQTLNAGDRETDASNVGDRSRTTQFERAAGSDSVAGSDVQAGPPSETGRLAPPSVGASAANEPDAPAGGQPFDNRRPSQPMSPMAYAIISLASFLLAVGLLLLYIFKAEDLVAHGIDARVFYVLTIPLGLCSAGFLFGVMRSYAAYTGKVFGGAYELGGPAVIAVAVVIGGFLLTRAEIGPFSLTIYVHGEKGVQDAILINRGEVVMDLGDFRRSEKIGAKGEAWFPGIPGRFRNQRVPVAVKAEDFEPAFPDKRYALTGDNLYIQVKRDVSSGRVTGIVRDETGEPLPSVTIDIGGLSARTNGKGRFDLKIPPEKQDTEQVLEAWLDGYELWRDFVFPENQDDMYIFLKKKKASP
ncbi:MAG: TIR domain-containing protein, partial [Desulfobacterales bacterium]|nr:TIR domain-containing protein [Desulfobacterales bacterium]